MTPESVQPEGARDGFNCSRSSRARPVSPMIEPVAWGALGATSRIAQKAVLPAIERSDAARLVAVASQSSSAGDYNTFGAPHTYDGYEALIDNDEVEAVYIPLPNNLHAPWTMECARAGKHVLCEKTLALSAPEGATMAEACASAGVRLMEAYVSPFHPRARALEELLTSGRLGRLQYARSNFTVPIDPRDHRWRPEMGGGALLDLGIYCLSPLLLAAGRPVVEVAGSQMSSESGVDISFDGRLRFGDGLAAAFFCSFEAPFLQELEIVGTELIARVDQPYSPGPSDKKIELLGHGGERSSLEVEGSDPYLAMVEHFGAALRGEVQLRHTPVDSVYLLGLFDRLRDSAAGRDTDD
ncbi:MAG: Gfo/Idh/MocA family oxidoreductase [Actinomycetota bacterium]|nr:Gfo/Idh/MocA family oxidoreductase [Actinomycetota bacterium]